MVIVDQLVFIGSAALVVFVCKEMYHLIAQEDEMSGNEGTIFSSFFISSIWHNFIYYILILYKGIQSVKIDVK